MKPLFNIPALLLQSVENPGSLQAATIRRLFNHFNIAAAAMLLLVIVLVAVICIKFRRKAAETGEGAQTTGNGLLEALMIGGPVLLLAWFYYESLHAEKSVAPAILTEKPDIIITGHQWWWEVEYPGHPVITANEIHLPVGRHLVMEMRSADVIHDWWVPELGNKTDLIPGNNNYLSLDIQRPGEYLGACSEFCGAQHAWMRIRVIAQNPDEFSRWLDSNGRNSHQPVDSLAIRGAALFQVKTCGGCHRIGGTPAIAGVGPDLTHIGSRKELLTGLMPMNEVNLAAWINHPQRIKPGARMPDFIFPPDSVKAIAHYLAQLK